MTKKKKIKLSILAIFVALLLAMRGGIYLYNYCLKNFAGFDKRLLENYKNSEDIHSKKDFEKFFIDFVKWEQYLDECSIDLMYCYGRKALFTLITTSNYAEESFSFIVYCEDKYEQLKEKALSDIVFAQTPIGCEEDEKFLYADNIRVDGFIFNEIEYSQVSDDFYYKHSIRCPSYWFAYNDEKREITFSYMYDVSLDYYPDASDLWAAIEENLYHG